MCVGGRGGACSRERTYIVSMHIGFPIPLASLSTALIFLNSHIFTLIGLCELLSLRRNARRCPCIRTTDWRRIRPRMKRANRRES